jgi:hypothetical protein
MGVRRSVAKAHENPVVLEMWAEFNRIAPAHRLAELAQVQDLFPNFELIEGRRH